MVSCSYSPFYEVQYPIHYSNDIPLQYYRKYTSYPNYIRFNSAPKELFNYQQYYDKNYYYPSSFYHHQCSYIKRTPNPYKRESVKQYSSPIETIHYYIDPRQQYPQKYVNFMPKSEEHAKFHNYIPFYSSPNTNYPSSYIINKMDNNSLLGHSRRYPNTYLAQQNYMMKPLYYKDTKLPQLYTETSPTTKIKNQFKLNDDKESRKDDKVQFMFPSEIVIKSLGPWAPIGNTGEYRSNGTFSIRYDVSKPLDFTNKFMLRQEKTDFRDNIMVSNKNCTDQLNHKNVPFDNKTITDTNLEISKDWTNEFVEKSLLGENDQIKSSDASCRFKERQSIRHNKLKDEKKKYAKAKNKIKNRYCQGLIGRQTNLTNSHKHETSNINKKSKRFRRKHSQPRISLDKEDFVKNTNFYYNNDRKQNQLKLRNQRNFRIESRKRAFVPEDFNCTKKPRTSTECAEISTLFKVTPKTTPRVVSEVTTERSNLSPTSFPINQQTEIKPLLPNESKTLKSQCEQQNNARCVCSIKIVLQEMDKIISSHDESTGLLKSLANYSCSNYIPIQNAYKIAANMKPRLISNKPKELLVDEGSGPKEILFDTIDELMTRGIPNEGIDFYVFPSTNIEIPCITTNKIQLSPNTADSTKYTWTHGDLKVITEGRFLEDINHRGSLQINGVTMDDSDNYTCTVNYTDPDTELPASSAFLHTVLVVSEPLIALHTLIHYNAKAKCDQEILEMFELYLPQQIEHIICGNDEATKICNVEIHNPLCHTKNHQQNTKLAERKVMYDLTRNQPTRHARDTNIGFEDSMEMSLNYQVDPADIWQFMPSTENKTRCSPYCQQKILLKVTEMLQESITDALIYPVESSVGIVFEPDLSTINVKTIIACSGGLQLSQGFCVPCPKEYYSEEGSTQCTKCPPGTYQDDIGAKICENCPHPFKEGCFAMWSTPIMIIILTGIVIILILIICLLAYMCSSRGGKACFACFRKDTSRRSSNQIKYKKMKNKSKKQKAVQYNEELPPTPPTEDFTA